MLIDKFSHSIADAFSSRLDTDLDAFRERHCGPGKGTWLVADYEAGDVVFHDVFQIHAAATNQDPEGKIVRLVLTHADLSHADN
jgi:ectoine hydroxylase-related dioxygenase (phytanoyl-CoA dioxygenase family)